MQPVVAAQSHMISISCSHIQAAGNARLLVDEIQAQSHVFIFQRAVQENTIGNRLARHTYQPETTDKRGIHLIGCSH